MIDPAQIPDEVVEAAAKAIGEETYVGNKQTLRDAARAAIAAALNAWPYAEIDSQYDVDFLILPLTQEPRT
jgi:hypothetical protein